MPWSAEAALNDLWVRLDRTSANDQLRSHLRQHLQKAYDAGLAARVAELPHEDAAHDRRSRIQDGRYHGWDRRWVVGKPTTHPGKAHAGPKITMTRSGKVIDGHQQADAFMSSGGAIPEEAIHYIDSATIEARDVMPGMRVVLPDNRVVDIDMVGETGLYRGTCMLFVIGEQTGTSVPRHATVEVIGKT